jgi:hypothetical protein
MFRTSLAVSLLGALCLSSDARVAADVEEKPNPAERPAMIRAKAVVEELAKDERHQHRIKGRIAEAGMRNPLSLADPPARPIDVSGKVEMKAVSGTRLRVGERLHESVSPTWLLSMPEFAASSAMALMVGVGHLSTMARGSAASNMRGPLAVSALRMALALGDRVPPRS